MKMDEVILPNREKILQIAEQYGARQVRVFGSVARRQDDAGSDIDFLVENKDKIEAWENKNEA